MARPVKVKIAGGGTMRIKEAENLEQLKTQAKIEETKTDLGAIIQADIQAHQELVKTLKEATLDSVAELKKIKKEMETLAARKAPASNSEVSEKYLSEIRDSMQELAKKPAEAIVQPAAREPTPWTVQVERNGDKISELRINPDVD